MRGYRPTVAKRTRSQHSRGFVGDLPFHKSVQPPPRHVPRFGKPFGRLRARPPTVRIGIHAKGTTAGEMPQCAALKTNTIICSCDSHLRSHVVVCTVGCCCFQRTHLRWPSCSFAAGTSEPSRSSGIARRCVGSVTVFATDRASLCHVLVRIERRNRHGRRRAVQGPASPRSRVLRRALASRLRSSRPSALRR